jgi:hypothetical protein
LSEKKQPKTVTKWQWALILSVSAVITAGLFVLSIPFGVFIVLSTDSVKTLIEGEATILGFFGLIAVYLLTSYDSRIDKLEEKIQDLEDQNKIKRFKDIQDNIKIRKKGSTISILTALGCLIVSFFLSLWILSILSINRSNPSVMAYQLSFVASIIASLLLFIGVFSIFVMIYKIGTEPK